MELNATIFVQVFIFMTLLLCLSGLLFKPILALFEEREKRIDGAKKEALAMIALAEEKSRYFDLEYEKARVEARHALSSLKSEADKEHNIFLTQVRQQAKEKLEHAEKELQEEERTARTQFHDASEALSKDVIHALMT